MSGEMRYVVNIQRRGSKVRRVEVSKADHDRIHSNLLRNDAGRIMVTEAIENGHRVYYVAPTEIESLEEMTADGWGDQIPERLR